MDSTAVSALLTFLSLVVLLVPPWGVGAEKAGEAVAVLVGLVEREGEKLGMASFRGGVKCLGSLLVGFCDLDDWQCVQLGFKSLLKLSIDKRPKVRKCAQECLEKVFRSFESSTVIKVASDLVYSFLEEYMPALVNSSTVKIDEGSKGDTLKTESLKALHLLNVLRIAIPFLSSKVSSKVLRELCKLMTSKFSALTRQILGALEVFFGTSKDEIIVPELDSIITSLTVYVSLHDKNPIDTIMHAANLLRSAMLKLHLVEPRTCMGKLPTVCDALVGLLSSADGNASQASDILKDLINHCMDKKLLLIDESQLFENITDTDETSAARSLCTIFESALTPCDAIPNKHMLAVISLLFQSLGELSHAFMSSILLKLANLMTHSSSNDSNTEHLQHCIGSAVVVMGPDRILKLLPVSFCDDLTHSNTWLLPILKKYMVGASLGFYMEYIVPLAKSFQRASGKVKKSISSKELQACAHSLLGLLPAFCRYPTDLHQQFGSLAKLLVTFLNKHPFMHETVAFSLRVLVDQNKSILRSKKDSGDMKTSKAEDPTLELETAPRYSKKAATKNIRALASCPTELLQVLVDTFVASVPGTCSYLQDAIGCLASVMDSSTSKTIFLSLFEKFKFVDGDGEIMAEGQGSRNSSKAQLKRCVLMDLASSFVEGAKEDFVEVIYNFIRQTFQASEEIGHREAYHALSRVLEEHTWFLSSRFVELIDMLLGLKSRDDVGSLRSRFTCFRILMVHAFQMSQEEENEKAFLILNEIILTLKDGKEEHRKAAYDVLVMLYGSLKSSSRGTSDELCPKLITMIMGYLSGSSPHIKSGAVSALSVLVYTDPEICLSVPDLVSSLLSLLHTRAIEVIKAVLGFVKVVVSSLQSKDLHNLLPDLVRGTLPWSSISRHHFRSKVTIILEILMRKCGLWSVESVTPEKYKRFVTTVLENRSVKSNPKEEIVDPETAPADSTKGSEKRKHEALDSNPQENGSVENKRRKGQKKTHTNPPGSRKPFASTNSWGSGGKETRSSKKGRDINSKNLVKSGSSGTRKNEKKDIRKTPTSERKRKGEKFRSKKDGASDSKLGKLKKFGKK